MSFLQNYPAFLRDMPLDVLDFDGRPLQEGSTRLHKHATEHFRYVACPYVGVRSESGRPMNSSALQVMLKARYVWELFPRQVARLCDLSKMTQWQAMWKVSDVGMSLANVVDRFRSRVPTVVAAAYRFYRGINTYAFYRLVVDAGNASAAMSTYVEAHRLGLGKSEVCPASPDLMDKIEQEMSQMMRSPSGECPASPYPDEDVLTAVQFGELCMLFQMLLALHAFQVERGRQVERNSPYPKVFDIPLVTRAAMAAKLDQSPEKLVHALKQLLATVTHYAELVEEIEPLLSAVALATRPLPEVLAMALRMNDLLLEPDKRNRGSTDLLHSIVCSVASRQPS